MNQPTQWMPSEPGWYPDPAGSGRSLWWDGRTWRGYLTPAQPAAYPQPAHYGQQAYYPQRWKRPLIDPGTPVYNALIWTIVFAPLLVVLLQLLWNPVPRFIYLQQVKTLDPFSIYTPGYFLALAANMILYVGTAVAAYFDWKKLGRDGVVRPFHWAWTFLSPLVYVIGRSVIVSKVASGRGWAPTGASVVVLIVGITIGVSHMSAFMTAMTSIPGY